jgi:uncharacterized protein YeeX (DUF496 family)
MKRRFNMKNPRELIKMFIMKVLIHQFNLAIPDKEKWIDEKTTELHAQLEEYYKPKEISVKEIEKIINNIQCDYPEIGRIIRETFSPFLIHDIAEIIQERLFKATPLEPIDEVKITCNSGMCCQYSYQEGSLVGCKYKNNCEYQCPHFGVSNKLEMLDREKLKGWIRCEPFEDYQEGKISKGKLCEILSETICDKFGVSNKLEMLDIREILRQAMTDASMLGSTYEDSAMSEEDFNERFDLILNLHLSKFGSPARGNKEEK